MTRPTIHAFTVEKTESGWLAHGCCSLGPVFRTGHTEAAAIHGVKEQIREMMRAHGARRLQEFQAKFPDFKVKSSAH